MNQTNDLVEQTKAAPTVTKTSSDGINQLIELAINANLDPDKLERLLAMREREEEKTALSYYNAAMARVQAKIEPIVADAENLQTDSRYAKLATVVKTLSPIYTEEGFSVSFSTGECENEKLREAGWFRTYAEVSHSGGYSKKYHVDLPADTTGPQGKVNKTVIHGTKSAISYARVILMGMIFNFTTAQDVDDDGNSAGNRERITFEQAAKLRERLEALSADEPYFCQWLGVDCLENITVNMYPKADSAIRQQEGATK